MALNPGQCRLILFPPLLEPQMNAETFSGTSHLFLEKILLIDVWQDA